MTKCIWDREPADQEKPQLPVSVTPPGLSQSQPAAACVVFEGRVRVVFDFSGPRGGTRCMSSVRTGASHPAHKLLFFIWG